MRTTEIVAIGVAAALALGLLAPVAYTAMVGQFRQSLQSYAQPPGYGGMYQGYPAYPGGMMGGASSGPGWMMGGYQGATGQYHGMMGRGMMGGYAYGMGSGYQTYTSGAAGGEAFVTLVGYGFRPLTLTVANGTTVTWVNMDLVQHTVTSGSEAAPTGLFDSHELGHMQAFSYTFNTPGVYPYYCDVHPDMVGTVVVTA